MRQWRGDDKYVDDPVDRKEQNWNSDFEPGRWVWGLKWEAGRIERMDFILANVPILSET